MSSHIARTTFLGLITALAGCFSQPIPLTVYQGSTFTLNLSTELMEGAGVGYRSLITEAEGDFDDQRGQIVPLLCPVLEENCTRNGPESGTGHELIVNYITSFGVNRASPAGIRNRIEYGALGLPPRPIVIALIDVPPLTPEGTYSLQLRIDRGGGAGLETFMPLIDFGGVTVLVPPQGLTVGENELSVADPDSNTTLYELVPNPRLELSFDLSSTFTRAAAADIQIEYPIEKIRVVSAHEVDQLGQASFVRLSHVVPDHGLGPALDSTFLYCATTADVNSAAFLATFPFCLETIQSAGVRYAVRIRLVDPDLLTEILGLIFTLRGSDPVAPSEFEIVDQSSYGPDGIDLSPLTWAITQVR